MKTRKGKVTAKRYQKMNPEQAFTPAPNPPVPGLTSTPRLKLLLAIAAVLVLIMIITAVIKLSPNLLNPPKPAPTPIPTSKLPIIKRVETLPENISEESSNMFGPNIVRADAKIEKVIDSGKSYLVLLASGEKITVLIGKITKLGDAWFEVADTGVVTRRGYKIISPEEWIKQAQVGSRVNVTFFKDKLTGKKQVEAEELVLND